jgi:phosphoglycolate phosphatase
VVTNKFEHLARQVLDALELSAFFPVVLGGDSLPERKPSAAPLLEACARLAVAPGATLMVGDSRTDIAAARAAKISVLCVPYGYNHGEPIEAAGADGIIPDLSALLERS